MNVKDLLREDDAVSPVIGVILMVAITVILAAVIGTFVLGLGDQVQSSAPNANFQFEYGTLTYTGSSSNTVDLTTIEITHNGGQDVDGDNIEVLANGNTAFGVSADTDGDATAPFSGTTLSTGSSGTYVFYDAGSSITTSSGLNVPSSGTLGGDATAFSGGQDVQVIWTSPNGDSSNTIGSSTVPS